MNVKIDVQEIARKANQGNSGKPAFDDGLENIQCSIADGLIKLSEKMSKKQMTEISALIQCAVSNAYKMGFIRGANVPEMTQNGFVSLMYDKDFGEVGKLVLSAMWSTPGKSLLLPGQSMTRKRNGFEKRRNGKRQKALPRPPKARRLVFENHKRNASSRRTGQGG